MGRCTSIHPVAGAKCPRDAIAVVGRCQHHIPPHLVHDAFAALTRTCDGGCFLEFTRIEFWNGAPMLHNEAGEGEQIAFCPKCGGRLTTEDPYA